jgi:5-methylcytosine-specific restriction endonuclease McrA
MKICTKCKVQKDVGEFHVRTRHPTGLTSWCKTCIKNYDSSDNGKIAHKRYYKTKREQIIAKVWNYQNRPQGVAAQKRYDQSDKGRLSAQQCARRRRERKLNLDMRLTNEDVTLIHKRFNNACACCGSSTNLAIDHHYPLVCGFGLSLSNAVLLCKSCNCSKSNRMPNEFYTPEQLERIESILHEST